MEDLDTQSRFTLAVWLDDYGEMWLVKLRWVRVGDREECVGFEVRSTCDEVEAFLTGAAHTADLTDAPPRRVVWKRLRRLPLPLIIATHRHEMARGALRAGSERAAWHREHGDRATAQDALRSAQARAEVWDDSPSESAPHGPHPLPSATRRLILEVAEEAEHHGAPKSRAVAKALGMKNPSPKDLARIRKRISRERARQKTAKPQPREEGS